MPRKKITKLCEQCGDSFIGTSINKYCSHKCAGIASVSSHRPRKKPKNIFNMSTRTISKILQRIGYGCSNCGWDKTSCDIHHINGRKISDPHNHSNLTLLCPNCHRLAHEGKLTKFVSLKEYIGDKWLDFYYYNGSAG